MPDFVHLHNHTHYSILDALPTPSDLVDAAIEDGQKAIALTDHGVMFGTLEFYNYAKSKGIKPIIGMEAYVANGDRFTRISGKSKDRKRRNYFHLVLLAKNMTGYRNLIKLSSLGHTEGFYYKPRIDKELLEKYHEGLVATSACIAGVVNAHLVAGNREEAYDTAKFYKELFDDDFYLELQRHNLDDDEIIMNEVPVMAKKLGIKMIATNDIHYIKKDHAYAHNVLLNIRDVTAQTSGQADIYKLRYRTPEMYFKSSQQMAELFPEFPEALKNTIEIADKCNMEFDHKLYMPEFPIPDESDAQSLEEYLKELTYKGIKEKYPEITEGIKERAEYELNVINSMGFPGYFLIVWDFVNASRKLGISVGPGRGSAAGSIVAYALSITNVDPLPYDLLFERFLNPERVSMPDIDIDFCDIKRERVIEYVKEKYGEGSVSQIITFGKLTTKAVITDVGRVLGIPLGTVREITSKIPVVLGKVTPLKDAIELPDLSWLKESDDPKIRELVKFSLLLEGKIRNCGTHAAGVVIAPGDVSNYVPLYQPAKSKGQGVDIASQFSMNDLEEAGLLKMDFLGLRTLSIIDNTIEMIERNHGVRIDLDDIDFEDTKTYELLSKGNTLGVFQFESDGMQDYLKKLKPRNLEELTAMNALYRPGPMANIPEFIDRKFGRKPIVYLHPIMEKSLKKTYGIIVYQEQVMQLVQQIAGFSLGQADILRRAMGKKKHKLMDQQKPMFIEGAAKNGINERLALEIFDLIMKFASYGFNKSHSLAYSYLAFQTAWLKTHYPAEFLAANMTAELNDQSKIVSLIEEAKKYGIKVLPPDVNRSLATFNSVNNTIFFGMAGIKNVGIPAVESIVKARLEKPFESFFDFVARVDIRLMNKRALEALVCSGAFDSLKGGHRAAFFQAIEPSLDYAKAYQGDKNSNMDSLFGGDAEAEMIEPDIPDVPEWTEKERLEKEKEYLSFYVSGHPLYRYLPHVTSLSLMSLDERDNPYIGEDIRICGMISDIRKRRDRNENTIAFVQVEDFKGKAECIFWSNTFSRFESIIQEDKIVLCEGKSELNNDELKIVVNTILPIEDAITQYAKGYQIWLDHEQSSIEKLRQLKEKFCVDQSTSTKIKFNIKDSGKCYIAENVNIPLDDEATSKLMDLFGPGNVGFAVV